MSEMLNEHWSRFLDGELSANEQQWLLDEISRGERLPQDPLADAETHGMLRVMSRLAHEDEEAFAAAVMQRLEPAPIALHDTQRLSTTRTLEALDVAALEATSLSPKPVAVATSAPPASASRWDRGSRFRWSTRLGSAVAGMLAAVVLSGIWITLPDRNAAHRPASDANSDPTDRIHPGPLPSPPPTDDAPPATSSPRSPQSPRPQSPRPQSPRPQSPRPQSPRPQSPNPAVVHPDASESVPQPSATPPPQGLAHRPAPSVEPRSPEAPERGPVPYPQPQPVWTIKDVHSQLVKWASPLPRDIEGKTLQLLEGSAKLAFGEVGEMTIHAPAEFRPEDSKLFLNYGRVMARSQAPFTIETPATGIEIINRANIAADKDGTAVTAIGPVGILSDKTESGPLAVPPGQFKWIAKTGHIYDWMVGMLEAEGVMTLLVNGEMFQVNAVTAANPAPHIQEYLVTQMHSRPEANDFRGVLLINGKSYTYEGARGVASAGRRLTSQLQQRRKAAAAAGVRLNINGFDLADGQLRVGAGQVQVAPLVTPNTTAARMAADELLSRQQQMIQSMKHAFGVDLSGAERAVEQARQRIHRTLPTKE